MKSIRASAAVLLASLVVFAAAPTLRADAKTAPASRITAEYVNPEKFTDFRDGVFDTEKGRQHLMEELNDHLADLSRRAIPEGQRLEIRFTNIDLAGDYEPWRGPQFDDIRILKDIYPPRMELEYRLVDASSGAVIRQGAEKLVDMGYLMNIARLPSQDALLHDKQMLSDWIRREFRVKK
jgi:hypothetical protein